MIMNELKFYNCIGKGHYGEVYLTKKNGIKKPFATKIVHKKILTSKKSMDYVKKEIEILSKISHKNIVKFYDVKENNDSFFLVMEFCNGGTLSHCLEEYKKNLIHHSQKK